MEISAKELRGKPGHYIEKAARGVEIVITLRGKKKARLIPYKDTSSREKPSEREDVIFGMWEDKKETKNVDEYIRALRRGRSF